VVCGDCLELMKALPDGCVDAVVTDPPFGIDWARASWKDDAEGYPKLMCWLVSECHRLVLNGWCFVFQGMPNAPRFHEWFPKEWRIFAACKNWAQIRPTGIWHSWDPVIFWSNGHPCRNQDSEEVINRDYFVGNAAGVFQEKREHPCPKPHDTMEHICAIGTLPNMTILDPFLGSGTTAVAAKKLGRHFLGFEISEEYCRIARERIALVEAQPSLFEPRAEQLELPR